MLGTDMEEVAAQGSSSVYSKRRAKLVGLIGR